MQDVTETAVMEDSDLDGTTTEITVKRKHQRRAVTPVLSMSRSQRSRRKLCGPRPKQDRKCRKEDLTDRELMEAIMKSDQHSKQPQDELDLFAKSVVETMRRFSKRKQAWMKIKIDELPFTAEHGD